MCSAMGSFSQDDIVAPMASWTNTANEGAEDAIRYIQVEARTAEYGAGGRYDAHIRESEWQKRQQQHRTVRALDTFCACDSDNVEDNDPIDFGGVMWCR